VIASGDVGVAVLWRDITYRSSSRSATTRSRGKGLSTGEPDEQLDAVLDGASKR
jgi:hypothetical protein